jgi:hypothetical protein
MEHSAPSDKFERGQPGGSLAREYGRRRDARERRTREAHPHIGGLLLALRESPQHEDAFRRGGLGEKAVAESIAKRTDDGTVLTLHNRRMPGGRGDVDHIAVAPSGVSVIDAKDITGTIRVHRPWFGDAKLLVNGRERTKLIDGLERQLTAVDGALKTVGHDDVSLQGVLCFTKADVPLIGTLHMRGHLLIYRRALAKRLNADGPLDPPKIATIAHALAKALPPA